MHRLQIGDLASATGTKVVTIRYYEKIGLMPPPERGAGNFRSYGPEMLRRLAFIRRCRALGFSIDQIRELLGLASNAGAPCGSVDRITEEHFREVEAKIVDLTRLAAELRRMSSSCRGGGPITDCKIIEAISAGAEAEGRSAEL